MVYCALKIALCVQGFFFKFEMLLQAGIMEFQRGFL